MDKFLHFSISALITITLCFVICCISDNMAIIGILLALGIGGAKELYDYKNGGVASFGDMFFDLIGVIIGYLIFAFFWGMKMYNL